MIKEKLVLKVILPEGVFCEEQCDSVRLCIADDKKGKGSGSYGIRKGHAKAVIGLTKGRLEAFDGQNNILSKEIDGGFATVEDDVVTVVADGIK